MSANNIVRTYETLFIIRPNLDDEAMDRTVASIEEYIKGLGANIVAVDKKGRRRLAYEVDKMRDGYYVMIIFTTKPDSIAPIKRMLMLHEDVIRSLTVAHEQAAVY